jgi:hypothetical protein
LKPFDTIACSNDIPRTKCSGTASSDPGTESLLLPPGPCRATGDAEAPVGEAVAESLTPVSLLLARVAVGPLNALALAADPIPRSSVLRDAEADEDEEGGSGKTRFDLLGGRLDPKDGATN